MTWEPGSPSIDEIAAGPDESLVVLRRDIHRHPELAGHEERTAALVADRLRAAGLAVRTGVGGHGVVGVLDGAGPGRTIAYRADMDAVAADEVVPGDFASQRPGAAHLCGHDLHTAIGVGIAEALARQREQLAGRVLFVFQPAEEELTGARAMIADGVLEQTMPAEIYALHCAPLPVGGFAVMPGFGQPGIDWFQALLTGPAAATDGVRLATAIAALSTVGYPQTPEDAAKLDADLQTPDGPLARFVLAGATSTAGEGQARVHGWVRAWPDERYPEIRAEIRRLAEAIAGARVEFPEPPFPAMVCSAPLSQLAATYLRGLLGPAAVTVLHAAFPFNGEDFALFLQRIPGAMFFLGVADEDAGINGVPHAPDFAADERAIGVGVRAMAGLLISRLDAGAAASG